MKLCNETIAGISFWFNDMCYDLFEITENEQEKEYLRKIQDIVYRSGATNLRMAEYFLSLENKICRQEETQ